MSVLQPTVHRFTRDEYYRMADAGLFEGRRVELIEGEIIDMAPQNNPQAAAITLAAEALRAAFGPNHTFRVQLPMNLGTSEPEPDVAVVRGTPRQNLTHPTTALLVLEIAETTLLYDRTVKSKLYARAAVPDYWVLDLTSRRLEARRDPGPAGYASLQTFDAAATLSPLAARAAHVRVADLLP